MILLQRLAVVVLATADTVSAVVGRSLQDPECTTHADCDAATFPQFCYKGGFCEPCTGGWWGEGDTGECRSNISIDGSCAVCAAKTFPPTAAPVKKTKIGVANFSFEGGTADWTSAGGSARASADELGAAPHRQSYLSLSGGGGAVQQTLAGVTVQAGRTYVATAWARAVNPPSVGRSASTKATVGLAAGGAAASTVRRVEAPVLSGVGTDGSPADTIGDDGVNIWFENGYRMHAAGWFYSQRVGQDPVHDPWTKRGFAGDGMATGPIIVPGGPKAMYDTWYTEEADELISRIDRVDLSGVAPNYERAEATGEDEAGEIFHTVLSHKGDQGPWVIDAHLTYDDEEDRLWMSWGGHAMWITEMDPKTGNVLGNPKNPEFDKHPAGTHTCVAAWEVRDFRMCTGADAAPRAWDGDANGVGYHEGPSLYKKGGFWYYCASYGSMGFSYTIRCCRSRRPDGPFVDKDNIGCTKFDTTKDRFGASMLLGPEGHQAVPGHPHMWAEADGREYLGYDFRNYQTNKSEDRPFKTNDEMGIRRLYWVNGWPTIWTPLTVTFAADDHPDAIGSALTLQLSNGGAPTSLAAFDLVEAYYYDGPSEAFRLCMAKAKTKCNTKKAKAKKDFNKQKKICKKIKKKAERNKCNKDANTLKKKQNRAANKNLVKDRKKCVSKHG